MSTVYGYSLTGPSQIQGTKFAVIDGRMVFASLMKGQRLWIIIVSFYTLCVRCNCSRQMHCNIQRVDTWIGEYRIIIFLHQYMVDMWKIIQQTKIKNWTKQMFVYNIQFVNNIFFKQFAYSFLSAVVMLKT